MRTFIGLCAALSLASASAHAQVINGEGTYEGSTLHDPPPETAAGLDRGTAEKKPDAVTTPPRREQRD